MNMTGDGDLTGETDPLNHKSTAAYDPMDRLEGETDPLEHTTKALYDADGNVIQTTDRRGKISKFSYDSLNRLIEARYGVSGETAESTITYGYDDGNRLTKIVDSATGTYTLEYDEFNRLKSITTPTGTISYGYNEAEERTSMTAPEQEPLKYTYDTAGRLTELKRGSQTATFSYDAANRRTATKLVDGIEERYGYDEANELTSIAYKNGSATLGEIDYSYEPDGRREAMWGTYAHAALPEAITNATYNADNEQTKLNTTKLSYDLNGNLTEEAGTQYKWNARNQLTAITGAIVASFAYDPFDRRVSKTINGITTKDLFDGPNVTQETIGSNLANLLTGLGPDELLALTVGKATESYLTEALGSTIGLAGSTAKVQTKYLYGPFGTTKLIGSTSENIYQFAGRENDGDGLYYNRARYYSPTNARLISQDSFEQAANGTNLYLYTEDSPMNATDPYGTETTSLNDLSGPSVAPFPGDPIPPGAANETGPGASPVPARPTPGPGPGGPTGLSRHGGSGERLREVEEENEQEQDEENETEGDRIDKGIQTTCDLGGPAGLLTARISPVGAVVGTGCAGFTFGNFILRPALGL
jgi:RHS repeat-associated protein